ncbi:MAG: 3'-5' exonuclease domain-containing protein 2 [Prevotellaceae bacterium]|nr:3'-5' exonuclease domain-containing protein 2 [Prevotellaceae bacterium]
MNYSSTIDSKVLSILPKAVFSGKIFVINDARQAEEAVERLSQYPTLGFDTETKPTFSKGQRHKVALLQLSANDCAYLFRLHHTGLPKVVIDLLENESVEKIGAAIRDDLKALKKIRNFEPKGFVDLQDVVATHGIEEKSVRKMAAIVLNIRISKSQQLSNWENDDLSEQQQLYAATDAWVCLKIHDTLVNGKI